MAGTLTAVAPQLVPSPYEAPSEPAAPIVRPVKVAPGAAMVAAPVGPPVVSFAPPVVAGPLQVTSVIAAPAPSASPGGPPAADELAPTVPWLALAAALIALLVLR